ncbi:hypothetical protein GCM10027346_00180 [Hymenobacter seoulensis]
MTATKKCPHCGQWTEWHQQPTDLCQHCGQVLEPYRVASNEERQQLADEPVSPLLLIEIKPDDNAVVKFFKYIVRGGQLAFAAIVSFLLWLVAAAAG